MRYQDALAKLARDTYSSPNGGPVFKSGQGPDNGWILHKAHPRKKEDTHRAEYHGWILESRAPWDAEDLGSLRLLRRRG